MLEGHRLLPRATGGVGHDLVASVLIEISALLVRMISWMLFLDTSTSKKELERWRNEMKALKDKIREGLGRPILVSPQDAQKVLKLTGNRDQEALDWLRRLELLVKWRFRDGNLMKSFRLGKISGG